jgi:transcriptional regulator with XRE-family HTH domain
MLHHVLYGARVRAKLTLQNVSERTGLTVSYHSQLENGKRRPSAATLPILGAALAISSEDLMEALAADNVSRTKRQKDPSLMRPPGARHCEPQCEDAPRTG